jgi:hypothetical protein
MESIRQVVWGSVFAAAMHMQDQGEISAMGCPVLLSGKQVARKSKGCGGHNKVAGSNVWSGLGLTVGPDCGKQQLVHGAVEWSMKTHHIGS